MNAKADKLNNNCQSIRRDIKDYAEVLIANAFVELNEF
jgi:hypothetical protein